jgi:hypothetical protein
MTIEYTGWEPYLERGGEPDYCEDAEPEEAPEELADDDEDMDDCETVAEYRRIKRQWADYLDAQAACHA